MPLPRVIFTVRGICEKLRHRVGLNVELRIWRPVAFRIPDNCTFLVIYHERGLFITVWKRKVYDCQQNTFVNQNSVWIKSTLAATSLYEALTNFNPRSSGWREWSFPDVSSTSSWRHPHFYALIWLLKCAPPSTIFADCTGVAWCCFGLPCFTFRGFLFSRVFWCFISTASDASILPRYRWEEAPLPVNQRERLRVDHSTNIYSEGFSVRAAFV